jgi:HlyD family secretion protein
MTFLIESSNARQTKVEIAHNNGIAAEVRGGLKEGQRVIVHPPDAVSEGSKIRLRN